MAKPTRSTGDPRTAAESPATSNRTERTLAFMVGGIVCLILACFIVMIIGWLTMKQIPGDGIWPVALGVVYFGPPIAFVLMLALLAITWTRKARQHRAEAR
ncbi:multidrug ABC transporter ATPase [Curtobacterium sp. PsM8]|uniref:multidrug ABC transporter ATPase n=1 Tax=Curtobacterium sp. PsM8 TaxID=3030532 RepID=UPI00263BA1C8|nr:multidrug ABC transporter ATPase [Curtobacterium sp. PsM8]MDN4648960.1 multidrug ABC transporter ATPase [Curtobacterium sp. PsM8]